MRILGLLILLLCCVCQPQSDAIVFKDKYWDSSEAKTVIKRQGKTLQDRVEAIINTDVPTRNYIYANGGYFFVAVKANNSGFMSVIFFSAPLDSVPAVQAYLKRMFELLPVTRYELVALEADQLQSYSFRMNTWMEWVKAHGDKNIIFSIQEWFGLKQPPEHMDKVMLDISTLLEDYLKKNYPPHSVEQASYHYYLKKSRQPFGMPILGPINQQ